LSAQIGEGGYGLDAPRHAPWSGTFGSFLLCSTRGGAPIVLKTVHYLNEVAPMSVIPVLRSVPAGNATSTHAPVLMRRGTPGHFESVPHALDGRLSSRIDGAKITTPCGGSAEAAYAELLTVMTFNQRGGWVRETDIDYTYNGKDYTLRLPYDLVGCGTAIQTSKYC
jgi:hypothetical protein